MSLKQRYRETIQPKLLKDLSLSNIHEVPKVMKVTVNRGLGEAATNAKYVQAEPWRTQFLMSLTALQFA